MTPDSTRIRAQYQAAIAKAGGPITYRRITRVNDVTPTENPTSTAALLVNGLTNAGATTISLKAATLTGFLRAGDKFTIGSTIYTIAADTAAASSNAIAGVTFTPALGATAADGAAATVTFVAETSLKATISSFPFRLIDGTVIQARDLAIIIAAADLPVEPQSEDEIIFNGETRKVVVGRPRYVQGVIAGWEIQAR